MVTKNNHNKITFNGKDLTVLGEKQRLLNQRIKQTLTLYHIKYLKMQVKIKGM